MSEKTIELNSGAIITRRPVGDHDEEWEIGKSAIYTLQGFIV